MIGLEYSFLKVNDLKLVKSIVWYWFIMMIGLFVLMFCVNNLKFSIWVIVFELVVVSLFIGLIILMDYGLFLFLEKMKKKLKYL